MVVYTLLPYGVTPLSFNNRRGLSAKVNHLPITSTPVLRPLARLGTLWNALELLGIPSICSAIS